jgi:hypothetical protein
MHEAAAYNRRDLEITATLGKLVEDVIVGRLALRLGVRLPVIVNKSDQGVAELLPAHTLFGDGKRIYTNAR